MRPPSLDRRLLAVLARRGILRRLGERLLGLDAELTGSVVPETVVPAGPLVPETVAPFVSLYPPGHFYSPVPDLAEVEAQADRLFDPRRDLPGVDLREEQQLKLFRALAALAREAPLPAAPGTSARYGVDNPNYGIGDASMLQAMLRHLRPRRYLEVGSGYTTALALDTNERYLDGAMQVTAIEPHPELLRQVVHTGDPVEVLADPVQSVPVERFRALGEGDVLFLDCSHVLKTGSDVQHLYTNVLPVLAEGVYVHVHDVFWPFEYLRHWVEAGRAWNEAYLLHAFMLFNDSFELALWNHFLAIEHRAVVAAELPAMLQTPGGAFWLRRRKRAVPDMRAPEPR
ncbi:MAG: class I SAM-dependent methyltransferase [Acidimicrobiales bacterium]